MPQLNIPDLSFKYYTGAFHLVRMHLGVGGQASYTFPLRITRKKKGGPDSM